jgi:hypothetical protein
MAPSLLQGRVDCCFDRLGPSVVPPAGHQGPWRPHPAGRHAQVLGRYGDGEGRRPVEGKAGVQGRKEPRVEEPRQVHGDKGLDLVSQGHTVRTLQDCSRQAYKVRGLRQHMQEQEEAAYDSPDGLADRQGQA